jgi:hypothetical protein
LCIPVGWSIAPSATVAERSAALQDKQRVLGRTLVAANKVFHSSDIVVVHNSGHAAPRLEQKGIRRACEGQAVYGFLHVPSKSVSAYYGAVLARFRHYEYVLVMDDDTLLPAELAAVLARPLRCAAYALAIAATAPAHASREQRVLACLQDIEYKLSGLAKLSQSTWTHKSSVLSPHGAANLWRADVLERIMLAHNGVFHGEDYQMGTLFQLLYPGERMGIIAGCVVKTEVPASVDVLVAQRRKSWDIAAHNFLCGGFCAGQQTAHFLQVLVCFPCTVDHLLIRAYTLQDVWSVIQDYVRVFLILYHVISMSLNRTANWVVITMYAVTLAAQWVIAAALNYVKLPGTHRPDLQCDAAVVKAAIAWFPFYRFALSFVRCAALWRYLTVFESLKRSAPRLATMDLPLPAVGPILKAVDELPASAMRPLGMQAPLTSMGGK